MHPQIVSDERSFRPKVQLYQVALSTRMREYQKIPQRDSRRNINLTGIKVMISYPVKRFAFDGFWDSGKGAKRGWELSTINPLTITTNL